MKIVFMGTPDFAVSTLEALYNEGHDIVAVITATDKYGGRNNKKLIESDVKKYAESKNLNILQPKNLKAPEFIAALKALDADLFIVVAFRMLPEIVWTMPTLGTFNLHGSLLPKYRGAAPIHWAVINGETETGVTSFFLKHKIDTGDVIIQESIKIGDKETTGDLYNRMKELGAKVVLKTVDLIKNNQVKVLAQDNSKATPAPKLNKENTQIQFDNNVGTIFNLIRGLNPFPTAWFKHNDQRIKVYEVDYRVLKHDHPIGYLESNDKDYVHIYAKDGYICLKDIQIAGKKRMNIKDVLNGYKF